MEIMPKIKVETRYKFRIEQTSLIHGNLDDITDNKLQEFCKKHNVLLVRDFVYTDTSDILETFVFAHMTPYNLAEFLKEFGRCVVTVDQDDNTGGIEIYADRRE
jgi:alpha-ketoglutarate-dependent taurine dioxygenase